MAFDQDKYQQAARWLESRIAGTCPSCFQSKGFELNPPVAAPLLELQSGAIRFNEQMPLIPVICRNCGHVRFFSAIFMGLTASAVPAESREAPKPPEVNVAT